MRLPVPMAALSGAKRRWLVGEMGDELARALDEDWLSWAHDGQVAPAALPDGGDWRTWVIMAGRGFGKTRAGAEWVAAAARDGAARIALVAASIEEARHVMVEGVSGLLRVAGQDIRRWWPGRGLLVFASGAEARLFSGAHPEGLRGPEHSHAWCDELAKWPPSTRSGQAGAAAWDNLQLGLRLGPRPRALVTTTPRLGTVLEAVLSEAGTVVTGGATGANPHLPRAFLEAVERQYGGTRLARQEIAGLMPAAREGALWTRAMIEGCRIPPLPQAGGAGVGNNAGANTVFRENGLDAAGPPPTPPAGGRGESGITAHPNALSWTPPPPEPLAPRRFARLAIGLDPPAGGGTCGMMVCAVDSSGTGHVLEDASVSGASPEGWARVAAGCWRRWRGQAESAFVVAEVNQGGEMVRAVLRAADPDMPVRMVRAHQGKARRAEPVAMLFEQRRVRLCGRFEALEAELLRFVAGGGVEGASPDRADALVWALSELMFKAPRDPRVRCL